MYCFENFSLFGKLLKILLSYGYLFAPIYLVTFVLYYVGVNIFCRCYIH